MHGLGAIPNNTTLTLRSDAPNTLQEILQKVGFQITRSDTQTEATERRELLIALNTIRDRLVESPPLTAPLIEQRDQIRNMIINLPSVLTSFTTDEQNQLTQLSADPTFQAHRPSEVGAVTIRAEHENHYPDIGHLGHAYFTQRFEAATRQLMVINWQLNQLPPTHEFDSLKKELATFAMTFLVHGAVTPIVTGREHHHMSPLEFLGHDVTDDGLYHRAASNNAITRLFKNLIERPGESYQFLFATDHSYKSAIYIFGNLERRDACILVDGPGIISSLSSWYNFQNCDSVTDETVRTAVRAACGLDQQNALPITTVLDLSPYMNEGAPVTRGELERRMTHIRQVISEIQGNYKNRPFFAQFPVNGVTVAVAFDTRGKNTLQQKLHQMATFGSRPDIVKLRQTISELPNATLPDLIAKLPITAPELDDQHLLPVEHFPKSLITRGLSLIQTGLTNRATEIETDNPRAALYYRLISQLLAFSNNYLEQALENHHTQRFMFDTLGRIGDLALVASQAEDQYAQFINAIDLMTEGAIHLMTTLLIPQIDIPALLNEVNRPNLPVDVHRESYIFTSGMKCNQCVIDALLSMKRSGFYPKEGDLSIAHPSDIYFEERVLLRYTNGIAPTQPLQEPIETPIDADIVYVDLLPNAAAELNGVSEHQGIQVLTMALGNRSPKDPVTVVIDTTTDVFDGSRIQDILATQFVQTALSRGTLNLVVIDSLAKFAQAGRDKYTGGVIQVYNNPEARHFTPINTRLMTLQNNPDNQLSLPANRFFAAMLDPKYGRPSFDDHLRLVREATNRTAHLLRTPQNNLPSLISPNNPIMLTSRDGNGDSDIPILALQFPGLTNNHWEIHDDASKDIAFRTIHNYILALAQARDLPLSARGSFGFDHSTLSEAICPNSMRLTIGLEGEEAQYADLLQRASASIGTYFPTNSDYFMTTKESISENLNQLATRTHIMQQSAVYRATHNNTDIPFPTFVNLCITLNEWAP